MITAKQVAEIAQGLPVYDFDYVGIRVQESTYGLKVGDTMSHHSSVWIDGEETVEELYGICAVNALDAARYPLRFGAYAGNTVLILGSNSGTYGADDGEIILREPEILDIKEI